MAALAKDVGSAKAGELHRELGTSDFGALVREHGVAGIQKLLDRVPAAEIKQLVAELGMTALKRLTSGTSGLHGDEVAALVKQHGSQAVKWAGDTLDGSTAKALLGSVKPDTLKGLQDVAAADAHKIVDVFGKVTLEGAVPPVTGKQLNVERLQLGETTAKGIATEKVSRGKPDELSKHAERLGAATAIPLPVLGADAIVLDTNVLTAIHELMSGTSWGRLAPHKQLGINQLRRTAKPNLPPLQSDPPARDIESIIGKGHDLRAANNTLGEDPPSQGIKREGFALTISRDSAQYQNVLGELAREPAPVGAAKGYGDRSIIADTMFAAGGTKPKLMTGDAAMIVRLFQRYGPHLASRLKPKHKQSVAAAIAERFPDGFDAAIPDGSGGVRTITIIPLAS
jgi:hypothetical protein